MMRWLVITSILLLSAAPAGAKVFCYYLIDKNNNVFTFREPPWDLSYPPPTDLSPAERKKRAMGHLTAVLINGPCMDSGKTLEEIIAEREAAEAKKAAAAVAKEGPTESLEVELDVPMADEGETEAGEEEAEGTVLATIPPDAPVEMKVFKGHAEQVVAVGIQGDMAVSGDAKGTVRMWEITAEREVRNLSGLPVSALMVHEGKIVVGFDSNTENLQELDLRTGSRIHDYLGHEAQVTDVEVSNQALLSGSLDDTLRYWNRRRAKVIHTFALPRNDDSEGVSAVALDVSQMLGAAARDDQIHIWNLKDGTTHRTLEADAKITSLAALNGKLVAGSAQEGNITIWNIQSGGRLHTLSGHTGTVHDLVVQEDKVVSASADSTIKIWHLHKGELIHTLEGHQDAVLAVAVDGFSIASGSLDKTVRVWVNYLTEKALAEKPVMPREAAPPSPAPAKEEESDEDFTVPVPRPLLAAGGEHTCAIRNGFVECVGNNSNGQLGDGTTEPSSEPVRVADVINARGLDSRSDTSCAFSDLEVFCWGWDNLIIQTRKDKTPENIPGIIAVKAVATGDKHRCALDGDGQVWCWGENFEGQLGDGTTSTHLEPSGVNNLDSVTAIAAGAYHTCALRADGKVKCWGKNYFGELGNGQSGKAAGSSVAVEVQNLAKVAVITAGASHSCALHTNGTVSCWGKNDSGQLGNGTSGVDKSSNTPVKVKDLKRVVAISAGGRHACAVLDSGEARCWGDNSHGQLGNAMMGETKSPGTPVAVAELKEAASISAGTEHTCVLLRNQDVYCWGRNQKNQLGLNAGPVQTTPIKLEFSQAAPAESDEGDAAPAAEEEKPAETTDEDDGWMDEDTETSAEDEG